MTQTSAAPANHAGHTSGARLVRHTVLGLVQQSISMIVGVLLLPFMLRYLGAERYGLLLTLQILSVSGVLVYADGGLPQGVSRFVADYYLRGQWAELRRLVSTEMLVFSGIGVACGLVALVIGKFAFFHIFTVPPAYQPALRIGIYLYAASFVTYFTGLGVKAFLSGMNDLVLARIWDICERTGTAVVIVAALLYHTSILAVVMAEQSTLFALLLVFLGVTRVRHRTVFRPRPDHFSRECLRTVYPMSVQVFINRLTGLAYQKAPDILIAWLLGPIAIASYAIVAKIPRALKSFSAAANSAAFPAAAALDSLNMGKSLGNLVTRGVRYGYLLVTPLIVFLVVFAPEILRLWVGPEYVHLANLLRGYIIWQYSMFLVFYLNATLTRAEHFRQLLPYAIGSNIAFFAVALPTIHALGLWSVMLALFVSGLVTIGGSINVQVSHNRTTGRALLFDAVLPVVVAVAAITLALFGIKQWLAPVSLLALAFTGFMLYLLYLPALGGALSATERARIQPLLRKVVFR